MHVYEYTCTIAAPGISLAMVIGLFDDLGRLANFANKAKAGLAHATTENGEAKVLGRTFRFEISR